MSKFSNRCKNIIWIVLIVISGSWTNRSVDCEEWGFYAHREINMLAIFLLPPELVSFYKYHISYIKEHAVDPDKRRYAVIAEAPKHYIDFEYYLENDLENIPENLSYAMSEFMTFQTVDSAEQLTSVVNDWNGIDFFDSDSTLLFSLQSWQVGQLYFQYTMPERLEEECIWNLDRIYPNDSILLQISVVDHLSEKGVNPYHIPYLCQRLERAMKALEFEKVLRLSADLGHYVSDNCVPLHCTSNYNGQETNQLGIHAFWESRVPELFASDQFDYFMEKAEYVSNIDSFARAMSIASYNLVSEVLDADRRARSRLGEDELWCYDERQDVVSRLQCPIYAEYFSQEMNGMVEQQMRLAIHSVASLWFSCWVNAGKPNLITTFSSDFVTDSILVVDSVLKSTRSHED